MVATLRVRITVWLWIVREGRRPGIVCKVRIATYRCVMMALHSVRPSPWRRFTHDRRAYVINLGQAFHTTYYRITPLCCPTVRWAASQSFKSRWKRKDLRAIAIESRPTERRAESRLNTSNTTNPPFAEEKNYHGSTRGQHLYIKIIL